MTDMVSLTSLFDNKLFRIPDYQRGYAWDETQLNDFWDDLYNLASNHYHYTGMLSLKLLKPKETEKWDEGEKWLMENNYQPYHIVDGQQRLTTAIILITSILNIATQNHVEYFNGISLSSIKEKFILETKKPLEIIKVYKFGYECDNPSFKYLRYKIMGEDFSGSIDESFYTLNLQRAKDFFDFKLNKVFEEKGMDGIETIYFKLVNKLQFNTHFIDDDFDVFVAFETMNNRGKKLSNLEILKNRLIYLSTVYNDNILPQSDKTQLRNNINDTWREVYHQLGRNKDKSLDDDEYLRNHWTLFYKYTRNKGDDYIQFLLNKQFTPKAVYGEKVELMYKQYEDDEEAMTELYDKQDVLVPKEISDYVNSLKEVAEYWYLSYNPDDSNELSNEEKKWINRLNHIGINYFRTLVVAAMINKDVAEEERVSLFKSIEKFIFLCFRLAKYNSNFNSVNSYKYARQLYMKEINIKEITAFFNNEFDKNVEGALVAFKTDMSRSFINEDGFYSWYPLKYFLFEYEAKLSEGRNIAKLNDWKAFTRSDNDKISVEHIFPQKPNAYYWRNNFRKYQGENEQHVLANSLGNLLALSQSVNSSLQNYEFSMKKNASEIRCGYSNGSYSEMKVAELEDWTPSTIFNRGMSLLSFMEDRWEFKFPNEQFKIDILGLNFLFDGRADVPEIVDVDYSSKDEYYKGEKGERKVSEYLASKDLYLVKYYDSLITELKKVIPTLFETATKNYIRLKCKEFSRTIAEIHLQNSKHNICIFTKQPSLENRIGEMLPDNFIWVLNYRVDLSEGSQFTQFINEMGFVYDKMLNDKGNNAEEETLKSSIDRNEMLYNMLKEASLKGKVSLLTHSKMYTRFASNKIRSAVGLVGDKTWSSIEDLIVWEINNERSSCKLRLYIGPGNSESRDKWFEFSQKNPIFIKGNQKTKWTSIYKITLYENGDSLDDVAAKFNDFMNNDFEKIDYAFCQAVIK